MKVGDFVVYGQYPDGRVRMGSTLPSRVGEYVEVIKVEGLLGRLVTIRFSDGLHHNTSASWCLPVGGPW